MKKNKEKTENSMKVPQDKVIDYIKRKIDNNTQRKSNTLWYKLKPVQSVNRSLPSTRERERERESNVLAKVRFYKSLESLLFFLFFGAKI